MYHAPTDYECLELTYNLKEKDEILNYPLKDYDDYEESVKVLQNGIQATKYNYCNESSHKLIIRLSKDRKKLQYKSDEGGFFEKLSAWKSITLTEI